MFTKQYLKTKDLWKVRFKLSHAQIGPADAVYLVGEFDHWDEKARPMTKLKNGDFTLVMDLEPNKAYQFRYLVDGKSWVNDDNADAYLPSPFPGVDNSVITL